MYLTQLYASAVSIRETKIKNNGVKVERNNDKAYATSSIRHTTQTHIETEQKKNKYKYHKRPSLHHNIWLLLI